MNWWFIERCSFLFLKACYMCRLQVWDDMVVSVTDLSKRPRKMGSWGEIWWIWYVVGGCLRYRNVMKRMLLMMSGGWWHMYEIIPNKTTTSWSWLEIVRMSSDYLDFEWTADKHPLQKRLYEWHAVGQNREPLCQHQVNTSVQPMQLLVNKNHNRDWSKRAIITENWHIVLGGFCCAIWKIIERNWWMSVAK